MKIVVGLAATAVALAGCGSNEAAEPPTTVPSGSASASASPSAEPSSAAPSAGASSAAPSASASGKATSLVDPCRLIPAAKAKALTGFTFSDAKAGTVAGSKLCSYVPTSSDSPSLIAQVIALTGDFDTFAAAAEKQLPGATTSAVTVKGADRATLVTAELGGAPTVALLAGADGVFYQVIVSGPTLDAAAARKAAETYTAALLAG